MRTIKFRVWDTSTKKMYYTAGLGICNNEVVAITGEVMEYTGKTDEAGNELYEGDIIGIAMDRLGDSYPDFQENDYCICEIIFEDGGFHGVNVKKGYQFPLWAVSKQAITKLGNAYENKDLV